MNEDLISRQAAIRAHEKLIKEISDNYTFSDPIVMAGTAYIGDCIGLLETLPSADRPTGKWIPVTNGRGGHECSECNSYAPSYQSGDEMLANYCPNCGVKMEVEHE